MSRIDLAATYPFQLKVHRPDGTQIYSGSFAAGETRADSFTDTATGVLLRAGSGVAYPIGGVLDLFLERADGIFVDVPYIFRFIPVGVDLTVAWLGAYVKNNSGTPHSDCFVNFAARATEYVVAPNMDPPADLSGLSSPAEVSVSAQIAPNTLMLAPLFGSYDLISAQIQLGIVYPPPFWNDKLGCVEYATLNKILQSVAIGTQWALPYRAYSKTCPAPPPVTPPKRWVTKTVCGTAKTYAFDFYITNQYGGIGHGTQIVYELPGLPTTTVTSGLPYDNYQIVYPMRLVSTTAYCKTVTVYE